LLRVSFNDRFGENFCIAPIRLPQTRAFSAQALAAPAKGGKVPHSSRWRLAKVTSASSVSGGKQNPAQMNLQL